MQHLIEPTIGALCKRIEALAVDGEVSELVSLISATATLAGSFDHVETIDVKTAAQILGIAERRMYEICDREDFYPCIIIDSTKRINRMSFFRWLSERQVVETASGSSNQRKRGAA